MKKILKHDFSHPKLSTSGSCRDATLTGDTGLRVENIQQLCLAGPVKKFECEILACRNAQNIKNFSYS